MGKIYQSFLGKLSTHRDRVSRYRSALADSSISDTLSSIGSMVFSPRQSIKSGSDTEQSGGINSGKDLSRENASLPSTKLKRFVERLRGWPKRRHRGTDICLETQLPPTTSRERDAVAYTSRSSSSRRSSILGEEDQAPDLAPPVPLKGPQPVFADPMGQEVCELPSSHAGTKVAYEVWLAFIQQTADDARRNKWPTGPNSEFATRVQWLLQSLEKAHSQLEDRDYHWLVQAFEKLSGLAEGPEVGEQFGARSKSTETAPEARSEMEESKEKLEGNSEAPSLHSREETYSSATGSDSSVRHEYDRHSVNSMTSQGDLSEYGNNRYSALYFNGESLQVKRVEVPRAQEIGPHIVKLTINKAGTGDSQHKDRRHSDQSALSTPYTLRFICPELLDAKAFKYGLKGDDERLRDPRVVAAGARARKEAEMAFAELDLPEMDFSQYARSRRD